jgi:hypothetical protein
MVRLQKMDFKISGGHKMTRVMIDPALLTQLQSPDAVIEVCDRSGQVIGYFHSLRLLGSESGNCRSPFSDEEIQRRRQQRTGKPLAEIIKEWNQP